jgi:hypothetical protein
MKKTDLLFARLHNQQLLSSDFKTVTDLVNWMGAMQAQDYAMAKWAIGLRMRDHTDDLVEQAINNASIVRVHILRPTWHFVSTENLRWMMDLTSPHIRKSVIAQNRQIGLDDSTLKRTNSLIGKFLANGESRTRVEIVAHLAKKNINLNPLQATNVMINAELDLVCCNGQRKGKQFTYSICDKMLPAGKSIPRDEALHRLAMIYFSSHGPATVKDFIWWSGLPIKDAKTAVQIVATELDAATINDEKYFFKKGSEFRTEKKNVTLLLPPYDEFTVGYGSRDMVTGAATEDKDFFGNGIFKPIIIRNGEAVGTWRREIIGQGVKMTFQFRQTPSAVTRRLAKKEATAFQNFVGAAAGSISFS